MLFRVYAETNSKMKKNQTLYAFSPLKFADSFDFTTQEPAKPLYNA